MDVYQLIDDICEEIERVFPPDGFSGTEEEYAWLLQNYGVTEDDDAQYIFICFYLFEDEEDLDDAQLEAIHSQIEFLEDDDAICGYLVNLLKKYQSNDVVYPGDKTLRQSQ